MKKIISILIVIVMLASSVVAMIPASAAKLSYEPDWADLKSRSMYEAFFMDGSEYNLETFWKKYLVTRESNLLSMNANVEKLSEATSDADKKSNACVYVSKIRFAVNANTKYEYELKVKSNSINNFGGVVFAMSSDNIAYSVYGGFNNSNHIATNESWKTQSHIITIHGDYTKRDPYVDDSYMGDSKYFEELELDSEGFASLMILYDGMQVSVYAKDKTGEYVQMGDTVTLASGSTLAFGAFSRAIDVNNNRTVSIKDAKITALNADAIDAMKASGEIADNGAAALEELIQQIKLEYKEVSYTAESWEALQVAIRQAELVIEDPYATEDDVYIAMTDLEMAIFDLEDAPIDTSELEQLISDVKSLEKVKDKYNLISLNMLLKAATAGEELIASIEDGNEHTQADVAAAIENINEKIKSLKYKDGTDAPFEPVPPTVLTALKTEIDACKLLVKADWQGDAAAWTAFEQELVKAETLYNNVNALQEDVDVMVVSLQAKKAALKATINKTSLKAEIDAAKLLVKDDWQGDAALWTAFEQELANAEALYNNASALQADVDAMAASLQTKKAALKKTVVKTALKTEIDAAKLLVKEEWQGDEAAWTAFEQELVAAEALYNNVAALQTDVDAMVVSLQTKKAALKVVDKSALKTEIDADKLLLKADWQGDEAAWTAFEQELANAEALYNNAAASKADVEAMVVALQTKKAALKKTVVKTTLNSEINVCKKYNKDAWQGDADAWTALEQELVKAEEILAKVDATQEEVDAMAESLKTKKEALKVTIYNKAALATLIGMCKEVKKDDWQGDAEAWTAFETELAKAEALYADPYTDQTNPNSAVNGVIDSLQAVKKLLKKSIVKTALKTAIDDAKLLKKDEWQGDAEAWGVFEAEIAKAEALYADAKATQTDVDAMTASLKTKKDALKITVIKTALKTEIDDCKRYNMAGWQGDADAWTAFAEELANAEALYADAKATQEAVDAMTASLKTKKEALKITVNKNTLKATIDLCKQYAKDAWQGDVDAWTAFAEKLAAAETLYADAKATQEAVDAMATSLQGKKDVLKVTVYNINALKKLIDNYNTLQQEVWQGDVDAWTTFAEELAKAEALYADPYTDQEDPNLAVNEMIDSLQAKKAALKVTIFNRDILEKIINDCKALEKDAWQGDEAAWTAFEQELANAEAVYANADAIQSEINGMIDSLQVKKAALKATPEPETEAPTTDAPATEAPTTDAPTTDAPTTDAPVTDAPTTDAPTTEAPTIEAPTTEAPTTEAPTTEAPTTEAPTTEAPTTEVPTADATGTDTSATEKPTTDGTTGTYTKTGGCSGAVVTTSVIVGIVTTLGAALVIKKKD